MTTASQRQLAVRLPIRVNLVTGFLGTGKTTAILKLLAQRPADQRWAVLVNEFGTVGVDGEWLREGGVAVSQVAGGCLCCVASGAFAVGLNRLVREERPERILIEPSGLGHPAEVLRTLSGPMYSGVLEPRATVTMVDPRHLASERHRTHTTWRDQVHLADVLVANKVDLCTEADIEVFFRFARELDSPGLRVATVEHGDLDPGWLDLPAGSTGRALFPEAHAFLRAHARADPEGSGRQNPPLEREDWWSAEMRRDGYTGCSWRFGSGVRFHQKALEDWLLEQSFERVKGIVATDAGWQSINRAAGVGPLASAPTSNEGRLEILHWAPIDARELDRQLRDIAAGMVAAPTPISRG